MTPDAKKPSPETAPAETTKTTPTDAKTAKEHETGKTPAAAAPAQGAKAPGLTGAGKNEGDIAALLLAKGGKKAPGDISTLASLATLQGIARQAHDYRTALGLARFSGAATPAIVAVSSGTDPEKDRALLGFLNKHPEINTVKPAVITTLGQLSAALSSAEEAGDPLALKLLQAAVDLGMAGKAICTRVSGLLGQPPATVIAPGITVGDACTLLGGFLQIAQLQDQNDVTRQNRSRVNQGKITTGVVEQQTAMTQQDSVRRLKEAARTGQAVPAPANQTNQKKAASAASKSKTAAKGKSRGQNKSQG